MSPTHEVRDVNNAPVWWSKQNRFQIFDSAEFLENWETSVLTVAAARTKTGSRDSALQFLADQSRNLWKLFTTDRALLDRDYMSQEKSFNAYLASFFLPNIERTRLILTHARTRNFFVNLLNREEICLLDYGSGPLSASIGFLIALDQAAQNHNTPSKLKKVKAIAVERSEKAVQIGEKWIKKHMMHGIEFECERFTSPPKDVFYDVIIAANVMNEIPEKHRTKTAKTLLDCLRTATNGQASQLLIIEPAQEAHARGLSDLRDAIVSDAHLSDIRIVGPCLHHESCPLSQKTQRKDWCWFKGQFTPPPLLAELDRKTEIDHSELAFSFLQLSNDTHFSPRALAAVCVSDEMTLSDPESQSARFNYFKNNVARSNLANEQTLQDLSKSCTKIKLCSNGGELVAGLNRSETQSVIRRRGDEVEDLKEFSGLILER